MGKPCTVCTMTTKRRQAVDKALVEGKTLSWIAQKYSSSERTVSRMAVFRHSRHALKPPQGKRLSASERERVLTPTGIPTDAGATLLERVERLILESQAIAAEAKSAQQWLSAVSALREVRANLELLGKLSGEISSQNINFANLHLTTDRTLEFLEAAEAQGPHIIEYMKKQFSRRFGTVPPTLIVEFLDPEQIAAKKAVAETGLVIEGSSAADN